MKNKLNVPQIRFKGFEEEWEEKELGEIVDVRSGRDYKHLTEGLIPVYGTGGYMLSVNEALSYDEDAIGIGRKGTIDKPYLLYAPFWTVDTLFYAVPKESNKLDFIYDIFQQIEWKKKDESTGVPSLSKTAINSIETYTTKSDEQTQIGDYFKKLDNLITQTQNKLDKLKKFKSACLQKMFPKNGAIIPEIRFKGFEGEWEEMELGKMSEPLQYGLNAAATRYDGINKYIRITDIDDENHLFNSDDLTSPKTDLKLANNFKLEKGDILFARTGASVGKTYRYTDDDGIMYFAGFLIRARIFPAFNSEYIFQSTLTTHYSKFVKITSQRSGQPGINAQEYSVWNLKIPKTINEQTQIGNYFQKLDNLISKNTLQLTKLRNIKKACLDKMFVNTKEAL